MKTTRGHVWIDYSGNSDDLSFKCIEHENGEVEVTEHDRVNFTKQKPMFFDGTYESGEHETQLDNWSGDIKNGKTFYQVDMFGETRVVSLRELIEFLKNNYKG